MFLTLFILLALNSPIPYPLAFQPGCWQALPPALPEYTMSLEISFCPVNSHPSFSIQLKWWVHLMDQQTGHSASVPKIFFISVKQPLSHFLTVCCFSPIQNCVLLEVRNFVLLNSDPYVCPLVNICWIDSSFNFLPFIMLPHILRVALADHTYRVRALNNIRLNI